MRNHKKLKKVMNELITLAKKVYPGVEYITYSGGHSGVDATIEFFSPLKYEDKLDKVLHERSARALVEDDVFISALTLSRKSKPANALRAK